MAFVTRERHARGGNHQRIMWGYVLLAGFMGLLAAWLLPRAGRAVAGPAPGEPGQPSSPRRYLIHLKETASPEVTPHGTPDRESTLVAFRREAAHSQRGLVEELMSIAGAPDTHIQRYWIANCIALTTTSAEADRLRARPGVEGVYPDEDVYLVEPLFVEQPSRSQVAGRERDGDGSTYGLKKIRWPEFHRRHPEITGKGVIVGQIDTGIHGTHVEFKGKTLVFRSFIDDSTTPGDENGHGTHISGTILGGNVSDTAIGVAPGVDRVVVAKVFGRGGGTTVEVLLKAMEWITDPDGDPSTSDAPRVVSNSWGGPGGRPIFRDAVRKWVKLGIFPSFAAGNSGPRQRTVGVPGGYPEAFAVGATDADDRVAEFSSRGPVEYDGKTLIKPDICAPGVDTYSAWVPSPGDKGPERDQKYRRISGTSMATPHLSGAVALLYQARPDLTIDKISSLLARSAQRLDGQTQKDNVHGEGRLDLVRLFEELAKDK